MTNHCHQFVQQTPQNMAGPGADTLLTLVLPTGTEAAGVARRFIAEHATSLNPDLLADAQLIVSELVTNAVLHGRPDVTLRVRLSPPGIGVVVTDRGEPFLLRPTGALDSHLPTGRGLLIVDTLASAWGVTARTPPPGKDVWIELHPAPDPRV